MMIFFGVTLRMLLLEEGKFFYKELKSDFIYRSKVLNTLAIYKIEATISLNSDDVALYSREMVKHLPCVHAHHIKNRSYDSLLHQNS
jgi:hypothetical protein